VRWWEDEVAEEMLKTGNIIYAGWLNWLRLLRLERGSVRISGS